MLSLVMVVVMMVLPPCEYEDSAWCVWNAAEAGNGEGQSFANLGGYVVRWQ